MGRSPGLMAVCWRHARMAMGLAGCSLRTLGLLWHNARIVDGFHRLQSKDREMISIGGAAVQRTDLHIQETAVASVKVRLEPNSRTHASKTQGQSQDVHLTLLRLLQNQQRDSWRGCVSSN